MLGLRWAWPEVVDEQQIDLLYRGSMLSAVVGTAEAFILSTLFWAHVPHHHIAAWLLVFAAVRLMRIPLSLAYRRARARGDKVQAWVRPLVLVALLQACLWGGGSFVLIAPGDVVAESALHVALVAVVLGSLGHLANYYPVMLAYTLGTFVPLAVRNLLIGDAFHLVLTALCLLLSAYMLINGRRQARAIADTYVQSRRNRELAEALQRENQATQEARLAAEQAHAAKTRFFAAANHDLRQPLHAMGLLAQTLQARGQQADVHALAGQIIACVDGLAHIVDELLELSRLDTGGLQPQPEPFALQGLLRELVATYAPAARAKGLLLDLTALQDSATVTVFSDRRLVMRAVSNLLVNAIRYTPQGVVKLGLRVAAGHVQLSVEDSGIGIAPEDLPRIWDEFFQVGNPARDRQQGLGLGLATVKRLSDLLGLGVAVRSSLGAGSVFTLSLPLAATPALPAAPSAVAPDLLQDRHVLLIEDDAASGLAMQQLLQAWGCEVRLETAAAAAVQAVASGYRPACVLADYRLGEADGCQALGQLRGLLGAQLPAALVTGDASCDRLFAARHGGLTVLRKPVKPAQLRACLNGFFAQA